MTVSERIDCMECGGTRTSRSPSVPRCRSKPGDVLVYLCGECEQRWDVVVDEDDLIDDD